MIGPGRAVVPRRLAWGLASVLAGISASLYLELRATSALSLALVGGSAWLLATAPRPRSVESGIAATVLGAVYALLAIAGRFSEQGNWIGYLAHRTEVPDGLARAVYVGMFAGLSLLFRSAVLGAEAWLDGLRVRSEETPDWSEREVRSLSCAVILSCWLPYVLCMWPGILTPDSRSQVLQGLGVIPYDDHHPIAHTLVVATCLRLGSWVFGSREAGIGLYSVTQGLLLAWTFAWIAGRLHRERVRPEILVASVALGALLPVHAMYSVTMWKNIPFACALVGESFALWDLGRSRGVGERRSALARFGTFGALTVLLQTNGLVAFVLPAVVALVETDRSERRAAIAAVGAPLLCFVLVRVGSDRLGVARTRDLVPAGLSVPVQQVARALVDGADPTGEQLETIEGIGPVSEIVRVYDRHSVDPMKTVVNGRATSTIRSDPSRFLALWWSLGVAHPRSYLAAWRDQTCGYWFPDVPYSNVWQNFESEGLGVSRRPLLGGAPCRLLRSFAAYSENVPLLGALRSIGLWVWVAAFMAVHAAVRGRRAALACFAPIGGIWASLLLSTPIYAELRYVYALLLLVPLLVVAPLLDEEAGPRGAGTDSGAGRG